MNGTRNRVPADLNVRAYLTPEHPARQKVSELHEQCPPHKGICFISTSLAEKLRSVKKLKHGKATDNSTVHSSYIPTLQSINHLMKKLGLVPVGIDTKNKGDVVVI